MHSFTGHAFAGKGKVSALKLVIKNKDAQDTFKQLSEQWDLSSDLEDRLEE